MTGGAGTCLGETTSRLADDPDWRQYTASHIGVDFRMPRHPALFSRKLKHRGYTGLGGDPGDSSSSVEPYVEQVEKQFEDEIRLGSMIKMDPGEAIQRFDATHGQHINDSSS